MHKLSQRGTLVGVRILITNRHDGPLVNLIVWPEVLKQLKNIEIKKLHNLIVMSYTT